MKCNATKIKTIKEQVKEIMVTPPTTTIGRVYSVRCLKN